MITILMKYLKVYSNLQYTDSEAEESQQEDALESSRIASLDVTANEGGSMLDVSKYSVSAGIPET